MSFLALCNLVDEHEVLKKRIAELEARECRLLTQAELCDNGIQFLTEDARDEAVQRKFAEVHGLKVKS